MHSIATVWIPPSTRRKALFLSLLCGLIAIVAAVRGIGATPNIVIAANLWIYGAFLLATYFSILCFDPVTESSLGQMVVDVSLLIIYVATSLSITSAAHFLFLLTFLFGTSLIKYILMLHRIDLLPLLRRKLRWNALGLLLCLCAFGGVITGYPVVALSALVIIFTVAQIYLLLIRPLYVLPEGALAPERAGSQMRS